MLSEIQNRDRSLRETRDSLERRVEERTAELRIAKEEADRANQGKTVFLANVSHELRTPLNGIFGAAEILRDQSLGELNERQREFVEMVLKNGGRLLGLIDDVLDLSRLETDTLELEYGSFSLLRLLDKVV